MAKTKSVKAKPSKKAAAPKKPAKETKPKKEAKVAPKTETTAGVPDDKQKIIETFAQGRGDTGSPEVQVALLSFKIERLTGHLEENKKDNHSRRGLLKVIAKRRRILNYLQDLDKDRYKGLIERLGLKK